jgi:hypothetical protein
MQRFPDHAAQPDEERATRTRHPRRYARGRSGAGGRSEPGHRNEGVSAMSNQASSSKLRAKMAVAMVAAFLIALCARLALGLTQNETDFPPGYDAVTAAPGSHRVIFENALVRVLEVTMPPPGKTEPMHHHHWPSFFLDWDTGGKTPHIRYHQPGDIVRDIQSTDTPAHPGHWSVHWSACMQSRRWKTTPRPMLHRRCV